MDINVTGLRTGVEIDYEAVPSFWVPGRVEHASKDERFLAIKFSLGAIEVSHVVDITRKRHARRIAPAGECHAPKPPIPFWQYINCVQA